MTREEFLNDTVNYYSADTSRRAVNGIACNYVSNEGKKCAIGRHLLKHDLSMEGQTVYADHVFRHLPRNIQKLGSKFLSKVQGLHDANMNWGDNGISKIGKWNVEKIKREFIN